MIFEVFTAVKMWIVVFWVVAPCSIVGGYLRFGGKYRRHLQDKRSFLIRIYKK